MKPSAAIVLALLVGCPTPLTREPEWIPDQYSGPDAGDYPPPEGIVEVLPDESPGAKASPCGRACENLARLGCQEGEVRFGVSCYRGCLSMASHARVPTACWTNASTREIARECGRLRCPER